MKSVLRWCAVVALVALPLSGAKAAFIDVSVAGWSTFGGYALPGGINSGSQVSIGAGSQVTLIEYFDVEFESLSPSWGEELVLSVNDDDGLGNFFDHAPYADPGNDNPGIFGPISGVFGSSPGLSIGGLFTANTGDLWVTAYETFNDGGNAGQDAVIRTGSIRIHYTAVPEPTSAMLAVCGLGLCMIRRRVQA